MKSSSTTSSKFVIDTSVLLHDDRVVDGLLCLAKPPRDFKNIEILIPLYALEELDLHKGELNERGQRAREIARKLDRLRQQGYLHEGVMTQRGVLLKVVTCEHESPDRYRDLASLVYDDLILNCARQLGANLITKDCNLRIRADALRVPAFDWLESGVESHLGLIDSARESSLDSAVASTSHESIKDSSKGVTLAPLHYEKVWGLEARNDEQAHALNMLLDPNKSLITLIGKAGTGKTLLALASGLQQVTEIERYERVLVSRAIFPLGRDIGYLPGSLEEKMEPWLQPIFDNLDFLLRQKARRQSHRVRTQGDELVDMGLIEVTPITFIRGRSIPRQYMIIDEAQNLSAHEAKTILTRAGEGTKIVLIGDPYQVDHPYLDAENNGLMHVVRKFQGQICAAHIHLHQGERSPLAELAANLL